MRSALSVFDDYLDMDQMAPLVKGLRRTGRVLGAVRDLDVFWDKTQRYLDTLPDERQGDLAPLRAVWEAERKEGRTRLLEYLEENRLLENTVIIYTSDQGFYWESTAGLTSALCMKSHFAHPL